MQQQCCVCLDAFTSSEPLSADEWLLLSQCYTMSKIGNSQNIVSQHKRPVFVCLSNPQKHAICEVCLVDFLRNVQPNKCPVCRDKLNCAATLCQTVYMNEKLYECVKASQEATRMILLEKIRSIQSVTNNHLKELTQHRTRPLFMIDNRSTSMPESFVVTTTIVPNADSSVHYTWKRVNDQGLLEESVSLSTYSYRNIPDADLLKLIGHVTGLQLTPSVSASNNEPMAFRNYSEGILQSISHELEQLSSEISFLTRWPQSSDVSDFVEQQAIHGMYNMESDSPPVFPHQNNNPNSESNSPIQPPPPTVPHSVNAPIFGPSAPRPLQPYWRNRPM